MWIDETKLELFSKAHHHYVYRKQNEAFKEKNTFPTVKHGGGCDVFGVAVLPLALGALNVCMAS